MPLTTSWSGFVALQGPPAMLAGQQAGRSRLKEPSHPTHKSSQAHGALSRRPASSEGLRHDRVFIAILEQYVLWNKEAGFSIVA